MVRFVRRYRASEYADRVQVVRAFLLLGLIDIMLRLDRRRIILSRSLQPSAGSGDMECRSAWLQAEKHAHWIEVASRYHVVQARCLHRALALQCRLRCAGIPSTFRIGVRKDGVSLLAHAWVEIDGKPVHEPLAGIATFTPLTQTTTGFEMLRGHGAKRD